MKLFSVSEFCKCTGISRALFYKLVREGNGPRITKIGSRTLISQAATDEWQRLMERNAA